MRELVWHSGGVRETRWAARALARLLAPGDLVTLEGELGAGKTEFVRGLAAGLGLDPAVVRSPTFTLLQRYAAGAEVLIHVDAYRLASAEGLVDLGLDTVFEPGAIVAIEWASRVEAALPAERLAVRLEHDPAGGRPTQRRLLARACGSRAQRVLQAWAHELGTGGGDAPCRG